MKQTCLYFKNYFRQTNKKMCLCTLCNKGGSFIHILNVKVHCCIIDTQMCEHLLQYDTVL